MFKAALEPTSKIDFVLDREFTPEALYETLAVCCRVMVRASEVTAKMRPLIGRLLVSIHDNPESYTRLGYQSFEQFMRKEVVEKLGVSRTDAYAAKKVALAFPSLSVEKQAEIGIVSMSILSSVTTEKNSDYQELLAIAENSTIAELKEALVKRKLFDTSEDKYGITIITSRAISNMWTDFVNSGAVQSACSSSDHGVILEYVMAEFLSGLQQQPEEDDDDYPSEKEVDAN